MLTERSPNHTNVSQYVTKDDPTKYNLIWSNFDSKLGHFNFQKIVEKKSLVTSTFFCSQIIISNRASRDQISQSAKRNLRTDGLTFWNQYVHIASRVDIIISNLFKKQKSVPLKFLRLSVSQLQSSLWNSSKSSPPSPVWTFDISEVRSHPVNNLLHFESFF